MTYYQIFCQVKIVHVSEKDMHFRVTGSIPVPLKHQVDATFDARDVVSAVF